MGEELFKLSNTFVVSMQALSDPARDGFESRKVHRRTLLVVLRGVRRMQTIAVPPPEFLTHVRTGIRHDVAKETTKSERFLKRAVAKRRQPNADPTTFRSYSYAAARREPIPF
jgi:hypothetical protein